MQIDTETKIELREIAQGLSAVYMRVRMGDNISFRLNSNIILKEINHAIERLHSLTEHERILKSGEGSCLRDW